MYVKDNDKCFISGNKTFLSDELHEAGAVLWHVRVPKTDKKHYEIVEALIEVKDCSKGVTLDFSAHGLNQYQRRIEKLDTLISELTAFRGKFVEQAALIEKHAAYQKKEGEDEDDD